MNSHVRATAGVTWALPVNISRAGAHLEAYTKTKATVRAIQWCHRFGQTPGISLSDLPQELVDLVVSEVVEPVRKDAFQAWDNDFACHENRCLRQNHIGEAAMARIRSIVMERHSGHTSQNDSEILTYYEAVDDIVWDFELDDHNEMECAWRERVLQRDYDVALDDTLTENTQQSDGGFSVYDEVSNPGNRLHHRHSPLQILKSDFGLNAWIAHQRVPTALQLFMGRSFNEYDSFPETTICYLTLPSTFYRNTVSTSEGYTHPGSSYIHTAVSAKLDLGALQISAEQRTRFTRIMKVLHLTPCVSPMHLFQTSPTLFAGATGISMSMPAKADFRSMSPEAKALAREKIEEAIAEEEKAEWPQLMCLAAAESSYYEYRELVPKRCWSSVMNIADLGASLGPESRVKL